MAVLFDKESAGELPKLADAPDVPMSFEGLSTSLFFTNFAASAELNYQINYAFNGDVYYYTFGDKLSMARIDGIAIPFATCPGTELKSSAKDFVEFYKKNKLGESDSPLRINVGGMVLSGYFVSLTINLVRGKENSYIFSFNFISRVN